MEKRDINWNSGRPIIYAVSGSGNRAGKTTFAKSLSPHVFSLANALRDDLKSQYPQYDWFNKDGRYKDITMIEELNMTMREVMVKYGQEKCAQNPMYWADKLCQQIQNKLGWVADTYVTTATIDDIRKLGELDLLRAHFAGNVVHYHVESPQAIAEPHFENDQLRAIADYVISWNR